MTRIGRYIALGTALSSFVSARAFAQDAQASGPLTGEVAVSGHYVSNPGAKSSEELILSSGQIELGGDWVFVTADGLPLGRDANALPNTESVKLTDLALLRLRARRAFGKTLELFAAGEFLAKAPSAFDASIWQEAELGVRVPFAKHFAFELGGSTGPTLAHSGYWWQPNPRLLFKASAGSFLRFALDLGDSFTALELNDSRPKPIWLDEVALGTEAQFGDEHGAFWARADYFVPLASSGQITGPSPAYSGKFAPQVRINLQVGAVLSIESTGWDAYAMYAFIDRGELDKPLTTLPILDGGFDQQQLTIGVVHRFGGDNSGGP